MYHCPAGPAGLGKLIVSIVEWRCAPTHRVGEVEEVNWVFLHLFKSPISGAVPTSAGRVLECNLDAKSSIHAATTGCNARCYDTGRDQSYESPVGIVFLFSAFSRRSVAGAQRRDCLSDKVICCHLGAVTNA